MLWKVVVLLLLCTGRDAGLPRVQSEGLPGAAFHRLCDNRRLPLHMHLKLRGGGGHASTAEASTQVQMSKEGRRDTRPLHFHVQELWELAIVVWRAYVSFALSLGLLMLLAAALSGTAIVLASVLHEDMSAAWAGLRHNLDGEPGFSPVDSRFASVGKKVSSLLDLTRAAAALGLRSAADKLKQVGQESLWKRGSRPIVYMVAGYIVAQWLALCAKGRMAERYKIDRMTAVFLQTVIKYSILALAATTLLKAIGVPAQGLDAVLASAGIAAGIASQKVLQNLASGLVLLIFRPFKIGDKVALSGGIEGWVTEVRLFETRLITDDRRTISYPNADVCNGHIDNLTAAGMRRVQIDVFVAGSVSVAYTRQALLAAIKPYEYLSHSEVLVAPQEPAPNPAKPRETDSRATEEEGAPAVSTVGAAATAATAAAAVTCAALAGGCALERPPVSASLADTRNASSSSHPAVSSPPPCTAGVEVTGPAAGQPSRVLGGGGSHSGREGSRGHSGSAGGGGGSRSFAHRLGKVSSGVSLVDLLQLGAYHRAIQATRAPGHVSGLLDRAIAFAALLNRQAAFTAEQRKVPPLRRCSPPFVVLRRMERTCMSWRVMVWVPALEHIQPGWLARLCTSLPADWHAPPKQDKWYVTINEAIARKLQEGEIKLLSQALEERGVIGVGAHD